MDVQVESRRVQQAVRKCIVGPQVGARKLAHETVAAMEESLLARGWPQGDQLGTFAELQKQFGLGRWACREAIAIMQMRGLIDIRRGPGGGLYVSHLSMSDVAKSLLLFVCLNRSPGAVILEAQLAISDMVMSILLRKRARVEIVAGSPRSFRYQLALATCNPAIIFVTDLLNEVDERAAIAAGTWIETVEASPARQSDIISAIHEGDGARAQLLARDYIHETNCLEPDQRVGRTKLVTEVASLNRHKFSGSLAARIIDEILAHEGVAPLRLGSEWEIGDRFGFNGEIVRQAVRMLEDIGIIESQRGRRGGVVSMAPQNGPVIRQLSPCLSELNVTLEENNDVVGHLAVTMVELAAQKVRDGRLTSDIVWPLSLNTIDTTLEITTSGMAEEATAAVVMENQLLDLADNPILTILIRGFALHYLFAFGTSKKGQPILTTALLDYNKQIVAAIVRGDVEGAGALARRKDHLMRFA